MNKANNERIEMIKTNGIITVSNVHRVISKQNLDFLIEQAERAQELEVALQKVTSSWSKKVEENKRLREVLEKIRKEGELKNYHTGRESYNFQARLANQVLEETEWSVSTSNGS